MAAISIGLFTACSDEAVMLDNPNSETDQEEFYITLKVTTPNEATTRGSFTTPDGNASNSTDDADDRLAGTAEETKLTQASIYFCVGDEALVALESEYVEPMKGTSNNETTIRAKIQDLSSLVQLKGNDVDIYVVGNTTAAGISPTLATTTAGKSVSDATFGLAGAGSYPLGDYGTEGHVMPLVNAKKYTISNFKGITATREEDIIEEIKGFFSEHTATNAWWNLTQTLELERAVARLEYDDRRSEYTNNTKHQYQVGDLSLNVKLYSLQPFNVNKSSYLFRQVVEGDYTKATATTAELLGKENGGNDKYNWVKDPSWNESNGSYTKGANFWNALDITEDEYLIKNGDNISTDNLITIDNLQTRTKPTGDDYYPWCYVSENTLPSIAMMEDTETTEGEEDEDDIVNPLVALNATGVAFNFMVLNDDYEPLEYSADGTNYPSEVTNAPAEEADDEEEVEGAANDVPGDIIITDNDGKWVRVSPTAVTENGATKYYYFLTYIGCIVHNDGSKNGNNFAPMYYGVVRNNTYQMSVSSISGLPRPKDPSSMYLKLEINVLAWARHEISVVF